MELLTISENLSQISKHLALLQNYISFKFGSDWASDFKSFCDGSNKSCEEVSNTHDTNYESHDDVVQPQISQNSSNNIDIDITYHEVKNEHLTQEGYVENVEQEILCAEFEDVEFKHCEDPLAPDHLSIDYINTTSVDQEANLANTFEIVPTPTLVGKSREFRPVHTSPYKSTQPKSPRQSYKLRQQTSSRPINTASLSNRGRDINSSKNINERRDNRWVCGICSKKFTLKGNLVKHTQMHCGAPISCLDKNCAKVFSRVYYMKEHYNTVHLNLKPHKCIGCNKTFGYKSCLTHHKEKCSKLKK